MVLGREEIDAILASWPVARLTTIRPDGRPHAVPIVFIRHDGDLWSPVDGKPKRGGELARVRHLRREPRVCLLLDDYRDDWRQLWWLRLDAEGSVVELPSLDADPTLLAVREALQAKYPQYARVEVLPEPATLLRFRIQSVASWRADDRQRCADP